MSLALLALLAVFTLGATEARATPPPATEARSSAATPAIQGSRRAVRGQARELWAQRSDEARLRESLAAYEQVLATPHLWRHRERDALTHLVRGYTFLGTAHLTDWAGQLDALSRAVAYGDQCLSINRRFAKLLAAADSGPAGAASTLKRADVPCAYWSASARVAFGRMSGLAGTMKQLPAIKALMERVGELDSGYYHGGADRFWGEYYAAIPPFAGRDLQKSKAHFDLALTHDPAFLLNHVRLASAWAVRTQDRATFERELNWVIAADPAVIPEDKPEMEAAQTEARALLAQIDEAFPG